MKRLLTSLAAVSLLFFAAPSFAQFQLGSGIDFDSLSDYATSVEESKWTIPDGAEPDQILEIVDQFLSTEREAPETEEDSLSLILFTIKFTLNAADKLFACGDELTDEQYKRAVELKFDALYGRYLFDKKPAELNAFVKGLLKSAKNEYQTLLAYAQKYNLSIVLWEEPEKKIQNLSEQALKRPEASVQAFGALIRYPIGRPATEKILGVTLRTQEAPTLGNVDDAAAYYDELLAQESRPQLLRESVLRAKLYALCFEVEQYALQYREETDYDGDLSEEAGEKETDDREELEDSDDSEAEATSEEEKENLEKQYENACKSAFECIETCLTGGWSLETRKDAQCCFRDLMSDTDPDDKIATRYEDDILKILEKDEDREMRDQPIYYRVHRLYEKACRYVSAMLNAQQRARDLEDADENVNTQDPSIDEQTQSKEELVAELLDYAQTALDKIDEKDPDRLSHALLLKAQAAIIREEPRDALKQIEEYLENHDEATEEAKNELQELKGVAVYTIVTNDLKCYDEFAETIDGLLAAEKSELWGSAILVVKFQETMRRLAKSNADLNEFKKELEIFKTDVERSPLLLIKYIDCKPAIEKIGKNNGVPDLFVTTGKDLANLFDGSDNSTLRLSATILLSQVDPESASNDKENKDDGEDLDYLFEE